MKYSIGPDNRQVFLDTVFPVFISVADLLNQVSPHGQAEMVVFFNDLAAGRLTMLFFDYKEDYGHHHEFFYDPRYLNAVGNAVLTAQLREDLPWL